jgi:hypothetical protein
VSRSVVDSLLDLLFDRRVAPSPDAGRRRVYAVVDEVPAGSAFPDVYVEDDGGARDLDADEQRYLRTSFDPTDGGRPYVKSSYRARTPDGKLRGDLRRDRLPSHVHVRPAGAAGDRRTTNAVRRRADRPASAWFTRDGHAPAHLQSRCSMMSRRPLLAVTLALVAGTACASRGAAAPRRTFAIGASGDRMLDSSMVFRLCAAPDSVLAGLAPCRLHDQAPRVVPF